MPAWSNVPSWFEMETLASTVKPPSSGGFSHSRPANRLISSPSPWEVIESSMPMRRLRCVQSACDMANQEAARNIAARFLELGIGDVLKDLLDALADMTKIVAATVITGAVAGGTAGLFAGGVGVVPGAAAGGTLGLKASSWLLAAFGLGALADDILKGLPPIIDAYVRGISMAWNGPKEDWPIESGFVGGGDFGPARLAAWQIASAHETVVLLILGALVSYLTRGRGDINVLARQMRGSERGSRLAQWMIKHEDHLKRRPDLKPPEPRRGALVDPPEHGPQREKRSGRGKAPTMPLHHVECFKADKLPASKIGEFERQLGGQERGLNRLTVQEYLENVANPIKRNKRAAAIARADFEEKLRHRFQKEFSFMLDPVAAKRKAIEEARNTMSNLAGLHNPDLHAGGRDIVSDFGDRQVNSSIGPQWRPKIDNLKKAAESVPQYLRGSTFINVKLVKC